MKKNLQQSFKREIKIKKTLLEFKAKKTLSKFNFKVSISKKKYIKMLQQRYISSLSNLTNNQILNGISEINFRYKKNLLFNDKLECIRFKKV